MEHSIAKFWTTTALLWALLPSAGAQSGCLIRVEMDNFTADSLWLGETFGRRAVPKQPMFKIGDGVFELRLANAPQELCHAIVYEPSPGAKKAYFTVLIPAGKCDFQVKFDVKSPNQPPVFINSSENEAFLKYSGQVETLLKTRDDRNNDFRLQQDKISLLALEQAEKALVDYQNGFLREHPQSAVAHLVEQWLFKTPPVQAGNTTPGDAAVFRQNWFREHFLEGVDIASESFWRSTLAIDWLDVFTFKIAMPSPDSVRWHTDEVFRRLQPNPDAQHYYLNYMLNSLEKMSRFNYDEAFIYLVDKYVKTEITEGYSKATRAEKIETAEKIERIRVGKPAPEVTLFTEEGSSVELSKIEADYLFLMFFQTDCSYCKKEVPIVKRLFEKYQRQGLKVVLVCGKPGADLADCFEYREKMSLPNDWAILVDGKNKSKFRTLFNVDGYPRLFLLDRNKTILYRRGGSASEAELEIVFGKAIGTKG